MYSTVHQAYKQAYHLAWGVQHKDRIPGMEFWLDKTPEPACGAYSSCAVIHDSCSASRIHTRTVASQEISIFFWLSWPSCRERLRMSARTVINFYS